VPAKTPAKKAAPKSAAPKAEKPAAAKPAAAPKKAAAVPGDKPARPAKAAAKPVAPAPEAVPEQPPAAPVELGKHAGRDIMCQIEILKDGHFFIARTLTEGTPPKEYKNTVFEDLLTEMLTTLQEQLDEKQ
jgi:cell pole-organizing protein PopZ